MLRSVRLNFPPHPQVTVDLSERDKTKTKKFRSSKTLIKEEETELEEKLGKIAKNVESYALDAMFAIFIT